MKNHSIANSLEHIGDDLIAEAAAPTAKKRARFPLIAAAAAIALLVAAVPLGIWMKNKSDTNIVNSGSAEGQQNTAITLPPIQSGMKITGMLEKSIGTVVQTGIADKIGHDFPYGFIVEAKVKEVLPAEYDYFGLIKYRVAVLEISEVFLGEGLPHEIYYKYPARCGNDILSQCDIYIMSLNQEGIERYSLIDTESREVTFFPMMFESLAGDPRYCGSIGFKNGVIDESFLDPGVLELIDSPEYNSRVPAVRGDTLAQTKARVREFVSKKSESYAKDLTYTYVTAADVFSTPEAWEMWEMISAGDKVFRCERANQHSAFFRRVINGFYTKETIAVYTDEDGMVNVKWTGEEFSDDDLKKMPDLGTFIEQLDLNSLVPPHTTLTPDMKRQYCRVIGWYTKVDGEVYGCVKVVFNYIKPADGNLDGHSLNSYYDLYYYDDIYYLAKTDGTFTCLEASEMEEVIGDDDHLISSRTNSYNQGYIIMY